MPAPEQTQVLEVPEKPWRWDDSVNAFDGTVEKNQRDGIKNDFTFRQSDDINDKEIKRANILLLGPGKAGKSSFINSVATLCEQRLSEPARVGDGKADQTVKVADVSNFCIYDTIGIDCDRGLHTGDILPLVNGNVKQNYEFNPRCPISEKSEMFIKNPELKDKMHCVVYVISSEMLNGEVPSEWLDKIHSIQETLKYTGVPQKMVLTKIDKVCRFVSDDVTLTFKSTKIEDLVDTACSIFRMKRNDIHPIKNYEKEMTKDHRLNILTAVALKQFLNVAQDYIAGDRQDESNPIVVYSRTVREQSSTTGSE